MKKIAGILLSTAVIASAIAIAKPESVSAAAALAPARCATQGIGTEQIAISGRVATMRFRVPDNCTAQQVSMVSFQTHQSHVPLSSQRAYATSTGNFGSGIHSLSVTMPPTGCFYQVDGFRGAPITQLNDNIEYYTAGYLIRYALGGSRDCLTPPVTATPTAATPPKPTVNEQVQNQTQSQTVVNNVSSQAPAPAAATAVTYQAPGKLADTGPGDVAATFAGVSSVSGLAFHVIRRRFSF